MFSITGDSPKRLLLSVLLLLLLLYYVGQQLLTQGTNSSSIPTMSKPSVFYRLSKSTDSPSVEMLKSNRQMWAGTYEMDSLFANPEHSAWASGRYEVPAEGVAPEAVGKLSDEELLLFREDAKLLLSDDWRYAPPDIRAQYEDLRHKNGLKN